MKREGSGSVFTFDSACESLGLNPEYLRRGMAEWTKAALAQRTQAKVYQLAPRPQRQSAERGGIAKGDAATSARGRPIAPAQLSMQNGGDGLFRYRRFILPRLFSA